MYDSQTLTAMQHELRKCAAIGSVVAPIVTKAVPAAVRAAGRAISPYASRVGTYLGKASGDIGAGAGVGGAVGGVGGAIKGGIEGYNQDGAAGALTGALSGATSGATTGALVGAGAGLATGGRITSSALGSKIMSGKNPLGIAGRFGQRQLHSVTGLTPGGAPRLLPNGAVNPEYMKSVERMGMIPKKITISPADQQRALTDPKFAAKLEKQVAANKLEIANAETAIGGGWSSVPGAISGVRKEGLKGLWSNSIKPQFTGGGAAGKAMALGATGLSALDAGSEILDGEVTDQGGRFERTGKSLGASAGYIAAPFIPIAGQELLGGAAKGALGFAGRGADALLNKVGAVGSAWSSIAEGL